MATERNRPATPASVPDLPREYSADHVNVLIYVRRYWQLVLRRWLVVLLSISSGLGISAYRAVTSPDVFLSYSVIGVAARVQASYTSQVQYQEAVESYYIDQIARMNNGALLERVASKINPAGGLGTRSPILSARAVRAEGSFLRMNVEGTDFEKVKNFAQLWAREFIVSRDEEKNSAFRTKAQGTREQLARNEEKLRAIQKSLLDFLQKNNIASIKDFTESAQIRLDNLISEYNSFKMRYQSKLIFEEIKV